MFNDTGVPAAVILGDTNREERDKAIAGFQDGSIKVLVNVIVATEGFDLPDASCIIIARPTMSLALYLQMVGRGLRPKPDGGDCLILDLAANSERHGLPGDNRVWSLKPRGASGIGVAPIVWCPTEWCDVASPATSHNCRGCGYSFGKDCERCGRWRSYRSRWRYEKHCGDAHQLVCDLCHIDAHIQAHLPVAPPLDELVGLYSPEDQMTLPTDVEIDDDLANRLSEIFKELLETERQSIAGADDARREELRQMIEDRESNLNDNARQFALFNEHIADLLESERPNDPIQQGLMIAEFVGGLQSELSEWKGELTGLENRPIDKQAIFNSVRNKVAYLLRRAAENAELLPNLQDNSDQSGRNVVGVASQDADGIPKRFYIGPNHDGIFAECDVYSRKRIVVLAGSTATKRKIGNIFRNLQNRKDRLIETGVLTDEGELYKFAKDHEFTSCSAAAGMVLGNTGAGQGLDVLKDAGGITFRHYYTQ